MNEHKPIMTTPSRPVTVTTLGAAIATILIIGTQWVFGLPPAPPGLEAALAVILGAVAGYIDGKLNEPKP